MVKKRHMRYSNKLVGDKKRQSTKGVIISIGDRFESWEVESDYIKYKNNFECYMYKHRCRCECGVIKEVDRYSLLNGESRSCGCQRYKLSMATKFGHMKILEGDL